MNEAQATNMTEDQMAQAQQIEMIGAGLMKKVNEQVSYRVDLEQRWMEDLYQYNGQYDPDTQANLDKDESRSKVFVNITRPKVNAVEASLIDMLYPTDDKNYGIRHTPVPELQAALNDETPLPGAAPATPGEPPQSPTVAQQAQALLDEAETRAEAMEKEIDDQLKEADYNAKSRDIIHNAVVLGTGVIKAPVVVGRVRQSWQKIGQSSTGEEVHVLEVVEDNRPSVEAVSPWDFFPDMSAVSLDQAEFIFERHYMTAREVRGLARNPGFEIEQIRKLLKERPVTHRTRSDYLDRMRSISGLQSLSDDNRYEIWEYHGPMEKEDLIACGCEDIDEEDPLDEVEGVVWFCGPYVLKAIINPMESDERPYSVFCWEEDDTNIFGFGVPYQSRNPQRVINSTWRMILDNGGLSVGPQVVIDSEQIEPADGVWEIRGGKVWWKKGGIASIDQAFKLFDVPSRQGELERIFLTAMRLVDEETSTPTTLQGAHAQHIPDTARGMSILMNNSNAITRRGVKNFDDNFTVPVMRRFYHWNMQFNPRSDIKGDFEPFARGTAALLVKEQQQQALLQFLGMTANPNDLPLTNRPELLRKTAQAMHLDADDAVLTDEEIEAQQKAMAEAGQANPDELRYQHEYKMHQEKLADLAQERQARMTEREIDREIAITKLMTEKDISYQQIEARLKEMLISTRVKRQNAVDEMQLKTQLGQGI